MDEFVKLLQEHGKPQQRTAVGHDEADRYRGRVPDALIRFWLDHGRGCYNDGKDWLCDPAPFIPLVEAVFEGDPEFHPNDFVAIRRSAFSDLTLWSRKLAGPVTVSFNLGEVSAFGAESWIDKKTGQRHSTDFIVGALFYRAKLVAAWVTEDDEDMLPLAIERCGLLKADEVYGFFPALQIGGTNDVANLRRVKVVEHLLFLAAVTDFLLVKTEFPDPDDPYGYRRRVVRRIGGPL